MDQLAGENHALPIMAINGYDTLGQSVPAWTNFTLFSNKVNMTHIRGAHTFTAGFDMRTHRRSGGNPGEVNGRYAFTNRFTSREEDGLTPAANLGHSYAAFLMGLPTSASADTNATFVLSNPYAGWYGQDSWRITSRLTLMLGLRMEYEWGRTERYDRVIGWFDPTAKLPITDAAQAAYARSPIPELPASQFSVLGGSVYPGVNGVRSALQAGEFMLLPRFGAAYQLDSKTVLRGGYGIYFDTLNAQNVGPGSVRLQPRYGESDHKRLRRDLAVGQSARRSFAADGSVSCSQRRNALRRPGGCRARACSLVPARAGVSSAKPFRAPASSDGASTFSGRSAPTWWSRSGYAGSFSDQIRVTRRLDALPGQYWNTTHGAQQCAGEQSESERDRIHFG